MLKARKVLVSAIALALLASTGVQTSNAAPKNLSRAVAQPDWLEKNIDNPNVRIVEVSTEPGIYERGHIKNAAKIVTGAFPPSSNNQAPHAADQLFCMVTRTTGSQRGALGCLTFMAPRMYAFLMVDVLSGKRMVVHLQLSYRHSSRVISLHV